MPAGRLLQQVSPDALRWVAWCFSFWLPLGSADRENGLEVGGTDGDAPAVAVPVEGVSERSEVAGQRRLADRVQCIEGLQRRPVPAPEERDELLCRGESERAGALDRSDVLGSG